MLKSITLLGSSSGRNAGDAALMSGIMDSVDAACGEQLLYEIPTIRPGYVRDNYRNRVVPVGMLPWNLSVKMLGIPTYRSIMRTDLSLVFDAILFDRSLLNPLFNFMSTLHLMLPRAKKLGRKIGFYDVGAGPVDTPLGRKMLKDLAELADFITVRDQESLDILRSVGVSNPRILLAADAALNLRAPDDSRVCAILEQNRLKPGEPALAVNINAYLDSWASPGRKPMTRNLFVQAYSQAVNRFIDEAGVPVVFVTTQHADIPINEEVIRLIRHPEKVRLITNRDYNHYDIKGLFGKMSLLCGMRLHSMILASSALTPVVGLAYQPKVSYYFRTLGLPQWSLSFDDFSPETLYKHIATGWAEKDSLRRQLERVIPGLKRKADRAAGLVASMHQGEDLDTAFQRAVAEGQ